jgi:two-component system osmolarity sensor histidine kinase EnvZ
MTKAHGLRLSFPLTFQPARPWWLALWRKAAAVMPKGLFARAILIVILPMVVLQCVLTYVFMERHWQLVTKRLSTALTQDIAAIIELHETYPGQTNEAILDRIAQHRLKIDVEFLPQGELPPALPKPFFSILDAALSNEIRRQIGKPFWLDTVGRPTFVEVRIMLDDSILRVVALRGAAYASNSHIFLLWMVGTSLVLITVAILFLRSQIKPILLLTDAAEAFGKGRDLEFHPRGAREVRKAGAAFLEMKRRIERAFEQRTAMLNGVSHDLRTILTRFKLSLALMAETDETRDLQKDVAEMQRMLASYLAFARGDLGDVARSFLGSEAFDRSRRECKKIEMLFAHLKGIIGLRRLRSRGPSGAKDEFLLAAASLVKARRVTRFVPRKRKAR